MNNIGDRGGGVYIGSAACITDYWQHQLFLQSTLQIKSHLCYRTPHKKKLSVQFIKALINYTVLRQQ